MAPVFVPMPGADDLARLAKNAKSDAGSWVVEFVPAAVTERAALPTDMRSRLTRMAEVIEAHGLSGLPHG